MENQKKFNVINPTDDIYEKSRNMILRCYHAIASQQQLSGVQVASYLMKCKYFYLKLTFFFFKLI